MAEDRNLGTEFTDDAWGVLYDAVDSERFKDKDAETIYSVLNKKLSCRAFGDYLRRYIYLKAGMEMPFAEVPLKEYQMIIRTSFLEHETPSSFEPTTAKLSALAKNWLTQQTVKRKVVFLLGFGLGMSLDDVNMFLQKALREQGINAKDPFEVICWYCFQNGYGYLKFEKLWNAFLEIPADSPNLKLLYGDATIVARTTLERINDDDALMAFVLELKSSADVPQLSVSARRCFDELMGQAKEAVAKAYNAVEEQEHAKEVMEYQSNLMNNSRISDSERLKRVEQKKQKQKVYTAEEITESDLEKVISSAIPVDRYGNLMPVKNSTLNEQFEGKRFSRQHISEILCGKADVTRFDLITLNFFIYSQKTDQFANAEAAFFSFVETTNDILERCYWGELNINHPYECFILMCILSVDPLGTYADVWEKSYERN